MKKKKYYTSIGVTIERMHMSYMIKSLMDLKLGCTKTIKKLNQFLCPQAQLAASEQYAEDAAEKLSYGLLPVIYNLEGVKVYDETLEQLLDAGMGVDADIPTCRDNPDFLNLNFDGIVMRDRVMDASI